MRRLWLYLLAALALLALCGARHSATIRKVDSNGTFYVVVETQGAQNARVIITGITTMAAAIDTAKVRLGNIPNIATEVRVVRLVAETIP